jgi:Ca-activated chloride channel family protein
VLGIGSGVGAPVPLPQGGFLQDAAGNIVLPRLDESGLRALAEAGGGRYARMSTDGSDLDYLLDVERDKSGAKKVDDDHALSEHFLDRGPWFVLVLLPLALLAFRRGWMMVLALALIAPAPQAQAFEWADLWQRPDQRAAEALAKGDAAAAQSIAADPEWRGSAAYRAEDFEAASQAFAEAKGSEAVREGKYEDAIAAYEQALQADPANQDAEANKKAVEDWLKRQQNEQQNKNQDSSGEQGDQDSQDENGSGEQQDSEQQQDAQQDGQQQDGEGDNQESDANQNESQSDDAQGKQEDAQEQENPEQSGDGKSEPGDSSDQPAQQKSAAEEAEEKAREEQQKQQLSEAIDQAMDEQQSEQQPVPMVSPEQEAAREQEQALNQWLQRVPDDPGGLLRRKFQLEYERRQRDGGGG